MYASYIYFLLYVIEGLAVGKITQQSHIFGGAWLWVTLLMILFPRFLALGKPWVTKITHNIVYLITTFGLG